MTDLEKARQLIKENDELEKTLKDNEIKDKEIKDKKVDTINEAALKIIEETKKEGEKNEVKKQDDETIELIKTIKSKDLIIKEKDKIIADLTSILTKGKQTGEKVKEPENEPDNSIEDFAKSIIENIK